MLPPKRDVLLSATGGPEQKARPSFFSPGLLPGFSPGELGFPEEGTAGRLVGPSIGEDVQGEISLHPPGF